MRACPWKLLPLCPSSCCWCAVPALSTIHMAAPTCAADEYVTCANDLITCKIANETNANAAGECQSQLSDVEHSYQECMSRNRRLLKLPGGRPAFSRSTV